MTGTERPVSTPTTANNQNSQSHVRVGGNFLLQGTGALLMSNTRSDHTSLVRVRARSSGSWLTRVHECRIPEARIMDRVPGAADLTSERRLLDRGVLK